MVFYCAYRQTLYQPYEVHVQRNSSEVISGISAKINDVVFTLKQFQNKRQKVCEEKNISINIPARGLASLLQRGIILKEKNIYSIHFKLIPYMRLKAEDDYGTALHEIKIR